MRSFVFAFLSGILFGAGLVVSGMTDTSKVLAFLDVKGDFNPALALVMVGAIGVFLPGYFLSRRLKKPLLTQEFSHPEKTSVDAPLLLGSSLFGIGWGLSGVCPGPAVVNVASLNSGFLGFFVAMLAGMALVALARRISAGEGLPTGQSTRNQYGPVLPES